MTSYYNEHDPYAAQWLRNLIAAGHIAPGVVDERSISDVRPRDLAGFIQCHFFAGIGVWSAALRQAGWPDDKPVWTGSCPCQPFSDAGKGGGFDDVRHLWPDWFQLIAQCRPPRVFGEQVASADGLNWLDTVQADLEGAGYAVGASDLCAAGIGAPHIRQRLWIVGVADDTDERQHGRRASLPCDGGDAPRVELERFCDAVGMADSDGAGAARLGGNGGSSAASAGVWGGLADSSEFSRVGDPYSESAGRIGGATPSAQNQVNGAREPNDNRPGHANAGAGRMGDAHNVGPQPGQHRSEAAGHGCPTLADGRLERMEHAESDGREQRGTEPSGRGIVGGCGADVLDSGTRPGPANGFWRDADWLFCRDGRWRPVEPGTFPLAHGASSRVGRLRAYGNGLCLTAAETFIRSAMGAIDAL